MSAPAQPHVAEAVAVNLIAVLVAVREERPRVLTIGGRALPSGPFELMHRSLQSGLPRLGRAADPAADRLRRAALHLRRSRPRRRCRSHGLDQLSRADARAGRRGGLLLARPGTTSSLGEDRRAGPSSADQALEAALRGWTRATTDEPRRRTRAERCAVAFGLPPYGWNEDLVLQRYELLFEGRGLSPRPAQPIRRVGPA